jgi:hypothetical protein
MLVLVRGHQLPASIVNRALEAASTSSSVPSCRSALAVS